MLPFKLTIQLCFNKEIIALIICCFRAYYQSSSKRCFVLFGIFKKLVLGLYVMRTTTARSSADPEIFPFIFVKNDQVLIELFYWTCALQFYPIRWFSLAVSAELKMLFSLMIFDKVPDRVGFHKAVRSIFLIKSCHTIIMILGQALNHFLGSSRVFKNKSF